MGKQKVSNFMKKDQQIKLKSSPDPEKKKLQNFERNISRKEEKREILTQSLKLLYPELHCTANNTNKNNELNKRSHKIIEI